MEGPYQKIYDLVGATPKDTFVFTSSGAEAINQVHWTAFLELARKEGKCHFITSPFEDLPTIQSLKRLEELGCFVKIAPVDTKGQIDLVKLAELIGPRTALISVSWAQGLTGVIQPIEEIAALAQEKGVLFHVDATYSLGKVAGSFADFGIDYLTFAGDRLHAVKGSGGLFVKSGRPLHPFVLGNSFDLPSLLSLSAAASQLSLSLDTMSLEVARLRDELEGAILKGIPDAKVLYADSPRLPNVTAVCFPKVHQETLLYTLQRKGLFAAIGGAYAPHIHRVLVDEPLAQTAISFSLSRYTTQKEIEKGSALIVETVKMLRRLTEDL
jgi:cysteine desulfurase